MYGKGTLVEDDAARLAYTSYMEYVLAWLQILKAEELLGYDLTPFHALHTILVCYVELVAHVDALIQYVEVTLII